MLLRLAQVRNCNEEDMLVAPRSQIDHLAVEEDTADTAPIPREFEDIG